MEKWISKIVGYFLSFISDRKILVIGDSHSRVFESLQAKFRFPFVTFNVCSVDGATVSGLDNPNSKTNAYEIFIEKINAADDFEKIVFLLGEVDLGFVIWYRATKYSTSIDEMLDRAVSNYLNLIEQASIKFPVLVLSAPLPTISDNNDWGEIANLRREVTASQKERTNLTIKFNRIVEERCSHFENVEYLNLDNDSIGDSGIVSNNLLNSNRLDHHYDKKEYFKLISSNYSF